MAEIFFILCVALLIILAWVVRHYRKATRYITDADDYMNRTKMAANIYYSDKVTAAEAKEKAVAEKESFVNDFLSAKIDEFPVVATVIADYETARENYISERLAQKKRPPLNAIKERSRITKEKESLIKSLKATEWKLAYLHQLLSWLPELTEPVGNASGNYAKICIAAETYRKSQIDLGDAYYEKKKYDGDTYFQSKQQEGDAYYEGKKNAAKEHCKQISEKIVAALYAKDEEVRVAERKLQQAERTLNETQQKKHLIEEQIQERETFFERFLATKIKDFPVLAQVIADYEASRCDPIIDSLLYRRPSAYASAKIVKDIREEKRALIAKNKAYAWELAYIRQLLPWISEIEEEPIEAQNKVFNTEYNKKDAAGYWLTPEEYQQLPPIERNQRALDRYKKRHKSNAEIGRDYERYIGYLYEKEGYTVTYYGIERGLDDLGRDLICTRGNEVHVVQCKCWSNLKKKVIREKHLNQLYGTFVAYKIARSMGITIEELSNISEAQVKRISQGRLDLYSISPVFYSTVPFSPTALAFAKLLNIECLQKPLGDYPMIKCNISAHTGEKIYHLPFDQQYDKCVITPSEGEFYASTVQEAEDAGFRRALRWLGNN